LSNSDSIREDLDYGDLASGVRARVSFSRAQGPWQSLFASKIFAHDWYSLMHQHAPVYVVGGCRADCCCDDPLVILLVNAGFACLQFWPALYANTSLTRWEIHKQTTTLERLSVRHRRSLLTLFQAMKVRAAACCALCKHFQTGISKPPNCQPPPHIPATCGAVACALPCALCLPCCSH
jgi:hypothetical protein